MRPPSPSSRRGARAIWRCRSVPPMDHFSPAYVACYAPRARMRLGRPADWRFWRSACSCAAGAIVHSASQKPPAPAPASTEQTILVKTRSFEETWSLKRTDHFDVYYPQDLDLHAERAAQEAERAYERVSGDLRHNLAFRVPIFLFRTTTEFDDSVRAGASPGAAGEPSSGDRILLAIDQPADRWPGLITHEVAHVFAFDILPGRSTATWVLEGLAEYERGAWDPSDLSALRNAVRANAVPALSRLQADDTRAPRLVSAFGHAAFDFIESRSGKAGVRQFLFALRQAAEQRRRSISGRPSASAGRVRSGLRVVPPGSIRRGGQAAAGQPPRPGGDDARRGRHHERGLARRDGPRLHRVVGAGCGSGATAMGGRVWGCERPGF